MGTQKSTVVADLSEHEGDVPVYVTRADVGDFLTKLTDLMRETGIIIHSDNPEDLALVKHSTGRTVGVGLTLDRKNRYWTALPGSEGDSHD